jgi:endonuclease/exonuclease/phosphatase family metal-dependent hydrolase
VKIRVLTLNLHKGFSLSGRRFVLRELREAIRSSHADLVFLQEVRGQHKSNVEGSESWDSQVEFLADEIWPEFAYGKNAITSAGDHGNAILSKLPILNFQNINLSLHRLEQRGLLYCEIEEPKTKLRFSCFNVHLNLMSFHRKQQWALMREQLYRLGAFQKSSILAGDFNDWSLSLHQKITVESPLREAHFESHDALAKTWPNRLPLLSLDRIYYTGFSLNHVQVLRGSPWDKLSDHLPMMADFVSK